MQIRVADWPMGLNQEIALIDVQAIEGLGLTFERDFDDLDYFAAAIFSDDAKLFALQRYDNSPNGGYTLIVRQGADDDDGEILAFLTMFGLPFEAVIWTRG